MNFDAIFLAIRADFYKIELEENFNHTAEEEFLKIIYESIAEVRRLTPQSKIYVLGQVPLSNHAANCWIKNYLIGSEFIKPPECKDNLLSPVTDKLNAEISEQVLKSNVSFYDPGVILTKVNDHNGNLIYRDDHHLNIYGAAILKKNLESFVAQ